MRMLRTILRKEFLLIFRNKTILRMIFVMPIMQLLVIPLAADYEVRHVALAVVDQDQTTLSHRLTNKLQTSGYVQLAHLPATYQAGQALTESRDADLVLTIPPHFGRDAELGHAPTLHLAADAVNGVRAGLGSSYVASMINDFSRELAPPTAQLAAAPKLQVSSAAWYNPHINYRLFMVPGILAILVTMVGSALTSLNLVEEKELGTIEQINVSPIKKWQFILGKLVPFWVLGLVTITLGMLFARLVFGLWPVGSLLTIYLFAGVYLTSVLGIGLLISTLTDNQQQATLFSFFITMTFVLLSGLYTPVASMPGWAQYIAAWNPPAYFVQVIRAIYIKGSTAGDMWPTLLRLIGFAVLFNSLAVWNYRKRSA